MESIAKIASIIIGRKEEILTRSQRQVGRRWEGHWGPCWCTRATYKEKVILLIYITHRDCCTNSFLPFHSVERKKNEKKFFKLSYSARKSKKYFGPKLFQPKAYPAQTFSNQVYPATWVSSELLQACFSWFSISFFVVCYVWLFVICLKWRCHHSMW